MSSQLHKHVRGGDWRTIENARGSLLGAVTADGIVELIEHLDGIK